MPEKIYVAASFEQKDEVRDLFKQLKAAGHTITADWTLHKEIASLISEEERKSLKRQYAIEDTNGVKQATVYALIIGDRKSTGAHIELGIALGANIPHICLIGNPDASQLFYSHPAITILPDIKSFIEYIQKL